MNRPNWIRALALLILVTPLLGLFESNFWALDQAQKTWGIAPFSADRFKTGSPAARAPMAVDLAKSQFFKGEKFKRVEKALGKPDQKFDGHRSLAYQIGGDGTDAALLVFLPDASGSRVEGVHIAKLEQTPPTPKPGASAGPKLLPIELHGEVAKSIFEQMSGVKEDHDQKRGQNVTCHRGPDYQCNFTVDEQGHTEPK